MKALSPLPAIPHCVSVVKSMTSSVPLSSNSRCGRLQYHIQLRPVATVIRQQHTMEKLSLEASQSSALSAKETLVGPVSQRNVGGVGVVIVQCPRSTVGRESLKVRSRLVGGARTARASMARTHMTPTTWVLVSELVEQRMKVAPFVLPHKPGCGAYNLSVTDLPDNWEIHCERAYGSAPHKTPRTQELAASVELAMTAREQVRQHTRANKLKDTASIGTETIATRPESSKHTFDCRTWVL